MKKEKMKRWGALSLMSLVAASASGFSVYMTMNAVSDKKENNDMGDYDLPDIDDNNKNEETAFSKVVNSLLNSKEISESSLSLSLKPKDGDAVNLNLKNLNVDLSKANTSIVNIASDLNVVYGALDQTLSLRVEGNEYCYLSFKGKKVVFNAPQTISDVMDMLRSIGILIPQTDSEATDVDLSSLLSQIKDMANDITVSDETIVDQNAVFDIVIPDIEISDVKIASLKLRMSADKNTYALKGVETLSPIEIQTKKDGTYQSVMSVSLNGGFLLKDVSSYQEVTAEQKKEYKSITQSTGCILSSVSSIIGNGSDVGIRIDVQTSNTENADKNSRFTIDGLMQAKINKSSDKYQKSDFINGSYALKLNHLGDDQSELNSLYAYHVGEKTYLRFNDLLKAKVTNTTLQDFFKVIKEGTGKAAFEVLASQMQTTIGSLDIEKLKNNDLSQIQGFLNAEGTYFDYDANTSSFILSLDGSYFDLTTGPIVIKVKCSKEATEVSENGIEEISIQGLSFKSSDSEQVDASVVLTPKKLTQFEELDDAQYSDFKGTVPLFSTLCDIIGKRQFAADYSITFNDRISDGSDNHFNKIAAEGFIGADLSKEGENKEKLLRSFEEGTYRLSMNASTQDGQYSHNLDMTYQNQNLYFGYDSIHKQESEKNFTVFKNYIAKAQLGQMKDLLKEKTQSDVSSVFDDVDDVLSILGTSEQFKNDIKKIKSGSLKGLDSILSIEAKDVLQDDGSTKNVISLTVNTDLIFDSNSILGKNIGKIVLSLNSKDDGKTFVFSDISIQTVISSDQDFSFDLKLKDYEDVSLTQQQISQYQEIKEFNTFTKAFYNLGTDLKKYGVKVEASYKKKPVVENAEVVEEGEGVSINGCAYWNMENKDAPVVGGELLISHPFVSINSDFSTSKTKADQKIKFRYQNDEAKDGQFTADYNDNMHILMNSSSVSDIVEAVSSSSKTSLLNSLLSNASAVATGMPILDAISLKAPSLLLDYPYVKKVVFDDANHQIRMVVDKRLLNVEEEGDEATLSISYSDGEKPTLTKVEVDLSKADETVCKASISLVGYDQEKLPQVFEYNDQTKNKFVDLNGFSNLTKMMIDTTEFNFFHFSGFFNLDLSLFASNVPINLEQYCFDLNLDASLYIEDNSVYGYLSLKLGDKDLEQSGYYVTEYAFKDNKVYIDNTRTDSVLVEGESHKQISSIGYRVSMDEFKSNILYYLVSLGLDMDDRIAGKTIMANIYQSLAKQTDKESVEEEGTMTTNHLTEDMHISLNSDFSSLIQAGALYNKDKKKFTLGFNFNSLFSLTVGQGEDAVSLLSFDNTFLKLYHQSKTKEDGSLFTPFYAAQLSTDVNVLDGLAKISLKGQISMNGNNGDFAYVSKEESENYLRNKTSMARFYEITDAFDQRLDSDYLISGFSIHTKKSYDFINMKLEDFANDYSLEDNGKKLTYSVLIGSEDYSNLSTQEFSFLINR